MFNLKGEMNSKEEILNKPQEGAQVSHWATTETTDGSRVSWNILFFKSFFVKAALIWAAALSFLLLDF